MRRQGFSYREAVICLGLVGILGYIFYPVSGGAKRNARAAACSANLKQIGLAVAIYSQDYNGKLPRIRVNAVAESHLPFANPYGWADALYPYLKSVQIFQCPSESHEGAKDAVATRFTDYYYNSNLDGLKVKSLPQSATTILFGDGNDGADASDARYNRNSIPKIWLDNSQSPVWRHDGRAVYVFVDGHSKWLRPEQVKTTRASKNDFSFALR